MSAVPLDAYGRSLVDVSAGADVGWLLRYADGTKIPFAVHQWLGALKPGDSTLVDHCDGVTLDVGCGPGRLAAAVAERGYEVLGVDIAPVAVQMTRGRGVTVLHRSIFETLPGEGRWDRVLLADGNIGIGGDPARLLARCAELLAPQGSIVVETDPPGTGLRQVQVRIESASGITSSWFPWAHLGDDDLGAVADRAGLKVAEQWNENGRWFAAVCCPDQHAACPDRHLR